MAIDTHVTIQTQELTLEEKSTRYTKKNDQLVNPVIESAEFAVRVSVSRLPNVTHCGSLMNM
jgi:hypothetical protein